MENRKNVYSIIEVIQHTRLYIFHLRKKWIWLILAAITGAALGLYYYHVQKPNYKAVCTFILEEKSAGGGLAGLASQFGVSIGSLGESGSFFAGDNILDILKSKRVVEKVLLYPMDEENGKNKSLADFYLGLTNKRSQWKKYPYLANLHFTPNLDKFDVLQDSIMNIIYETILNNNLSVGRSSKQGSIIKVQVTAENSLFARLMTERLVDEASKLYLSIRVGRAEANIKDLQQRSDSLLFLLNRKSFTAALSQPLDVNPAIKTANVPVEIALRDKTVLATLYGEVVKNLEMSKLMLAQQTPVIQVLDTPGMTLKNQKRGMMFLIIVFTVGSVLVAIAMITFLYIGESVLKTTAKEFSLPKS